MTWTHTQARFANLLDEFNTQARLPVGHFDDDLGGARVSELGGEECTEVATLASERHTRHPDTRAEALRGQRHSSK